METQTYNTDSQKLNQLNSNLTAVLEILREAVQAFGEVAKPISDMEELRGFYDIRGDSRKLTPSRVESAIINRAIGTEPVIFAGVTITPAKLRGMVTIPDLTAVITALRKLEEPILSVGWKDAIYWQAYTITPAGVELVEDQVEALRSPYLHRADTPERQKRLGQVNKLIRAVEEFYRAQPEGFPPEELTIPGLYSWTDGNYTASPSYVERGRPASRIDMASLFPPMGRTKGQNMKSEPPGGAVPIYQTPEDMEIGERVRKMAQARNKPQTATI